jgi:hypothetical protein
MTRGGMCLKVNETYTSQVCSCCAWCQRVGRKVSQDSETGLGNRTWKQDLETGLGNRTWNLWNGASPRRKRRQETSSVSGWRRLQEEPVSEDAGKFRHSGGGSSHYIYCLRLAGQSSTSSLSD